MSDEQEPKQLFTFRSEANGQHAFEFKTSDGAMPLVIRQDGKFIVHGNVVAEDREVYDGFCEWLNRVMGPDFVVPVKAERRLQIVPKREADVIVLGGRQRRPWPPKR